MANTNLYSIKLLTNGDQMVNLKNVAITDPQFTIEKQCDRCLNILYFSEAVVTDVETDPEGNVLHSSIVCPICGNVVVLYSRSTDAQDPAVDPA